MRETSSIYEEDLDQLAEKVVGLLNEIDHDKAKVIFLEGDLGAGKTTFTKSLASKLGIQKEEVHSPTFILKKEYKATHPIFRKLIHIDAYRFVEPNEEKVLKLEDDMLDPSNIIAIEWPSKMPKKDADIVLSFAVLDDSTRAVTIFHEKEQ